MSEKGGIGMELSGRTYPLMNKTALLHLTPGDFVKPGEFGVQQSTLPFFQVLLNVAAFIVWLIVFLYFWKLIYYQVEDPYATPYGDAPPNYKRRSSEVDSLWERVSRAIERLSKYTQAHN